MDESVLGKMEFGESFFEKNHGKLANGWNSMPKMFPTVSHMFTYHIGNRAVKLLTL